MRRTFYLRATAIALLSVPVGVGALLAVLIAFGGGEAATIPVFLVSTSIIPQVCLVASAAVWWSRRALLPVVIVAGLMTLLGIYHSIWHGLNHPESFFDFSRSLVIVAGPLAATITGSLSYIERRRGRVGERPSSRAVRSVFALPAVVVALLATSAGMTLSASSGEIGSANAAVVVLAQDRFQPHNLDVETGEVTFHIINEDSYAHTFTVDDVEIDQYVGPNAERLLTFEVPDGTERLELYCAVLGHEEMRGALNVRRSQEA